MIGYHYIRLDNSVFEMKKYIIESLVSGAIYCIGLLALDARPGHQFKAVGFYLISSVIFGLLFSLVMRLIQKRIGKKSDKK
jgi:ABC-type nitrate/sulfonate/bicarbonate transport system permease component